MGIVRTQGDFAKLIGINPTNLSKVLNGNEAYLTENFLSKVRSAAEYYLTSPTQQEIEQEMVYTTG